jgi:hypothetical protein
MVGQKSLGLLAINLFTVWVAHRSLSLGHALSADSGNRLNRFDSQNPFNRID